jgi:hypothetical protein
MLNPMSWHTFRLTSAQKDAGGAIKVLNQFEDWFTRLDAPPDMAMFCVQWSGADFVTYYLSPAIEQRAPALLRVLGAKPGEPPPINATLLAGATGSKPRDFK